MKIAIFHELHSGGARRTANEFARVLKKHHTLDLFIVDEVKNPKEEIFYNNINFYKFRDKKWSGKNWKVRLYKDTLELIKLNNLHKKIAKEINKKKYDIVLIYPSKYTQAPFILRFVKHTKVYFAMEPLRLVYDPTLSIPKGLDFFHYTYEKINRIIRKIIDKRNLDLADKIIAPSKFSADFSSHVYKKNVRVIYVGIHSDFFTASQKKRDFDILYVGSKDPYNGYAFFKEVLKHVTSTYSAREVLFENEWLNDIQIRDIYRRTKILLATSYNELLGLIPLEAMGCGVVVLAVDEAGYRETVKTQENGYLLQRNAKTFAKKIDYLLHNESLLKSMSQKASQNIHSFWDWEERTKDLEDLLINSK